MTARINVTKFRYGYQRMIKQKQLKIENEFTDEERKQRDTSAGELDEWGARLHMQGVTELSNTLAKQFVEVLLNGKANDTLKVILYDNYVKAIELTMLFEDETPEDMSESTKSRVKSYANKLVAGIMSSRDVTNLDISKPYVDTGDLSAVVSEVKAEYEAGARRTEPVKVGAEIARRSVQLAPDLVSENAS